MKFKRNITAAAMALSLVAGVALATTTTETQPTTGPGYGYGMMDGQGPHHGAKMHKKGMMRGKSQGCAMNGPGMGKMMMQGGRGMHHGGAMMNPEMLEKRNQFLDSTVELRKQLHDKHFSYMEASRNPSATQGELQAQQNEIYTMRQELQAKRQAIFTTK